MFAALRRWFIPKPPAAVDATYIALVAAARNPFFYNVLKVPDTLDGRFEMIVLHLFLLQHRLIEGSIAPYTALCADEGITLELPPLRGSRRAIRTVQYENNAAFAQFLSEAFFYDMDNCIRELGVADTGVAHRIKRMGKAYHGCLQAYTAGLKDTTALRAALARNVYGTVEDGDVQVLDRLAAYVETMVAQLATLDTSVIMRGDYVWPNVASLGL